MSQMTYDYRTSLGENLEVDVDYIAVCDPNYGADADGKKGIECWSLSDIVVELYYNDNNITKSFAATYPEEYLDIIADAADKALDAAAEKDPEFYEGIDDDD